LSAYDEPASYCRASGIWGADYLSLLSAKRRIHLRRRRQA